MTDCVKFRQQNNEKMSVEKPVESVHNLTEVMKIM